jgi:hypothetical protein
MDEAILDTDILSEVLKRKDRLVRPNLQRAFFCCMNADRTVKMHSHLTGGTQMAKKISGRKKPAQKSSAKKSSAKKRPAKRSAAKKSAGSKKPRRGVKSPKGLRSTKRPKRKAPTAANYGPSLFLTAASETAKAYEIDATPHPRTILSYREEYADIREFEQPDGKILYRVKCLQSTAD